MSKISLPRPQSAFVVLGLFILGCATLSPPISTSSLRRLVTPHPYWGEISVHLSKDDHRVYFKAILEFTPPDKAALQVIDSFGRTLADYRMEKGRVIPVYASSGSPSWENDAFFPASWFPVALTLLGGWLPGHPDHSPVSCRGGYRLDYSSPDGSYFIFIDQHLNPLRLIGGSDEITIKIDPGKDGFAERLRIVSKLGEVEITNRGLELVPDFSEERR